MTARRTAAHLLAVTAIGCAAVAVLASAAGAGGGGRTYTVAMTGAQEVNASGVPNQGDPDGVGTGSITVNVGQGTVCWDFEVSGIAAPTRGHIHEAAAGANGPIVVGFFEADSVALAGCRTAERDLLRELLVAPEHFYLNVHNAQFPGGALRGQLSR